jgi:hypothetical protein
VSNLVADLAAATSACINALWIISAPIMLSRGRKEAERAKKPFDLDPHLEPFVRIVGSMSAATRQSPEGVKLAALADAAALIRARIAELGGPEHIDRGVIEDARRALASFGIGAPAEGWDRHTGLGRR